MNIALLIRFAHKMLYCIQVTFMPVTLQLFIRETLLHFEELDPIFWHKCLIRVLGS